MLNPNITATNPIPNWQRGLSDSLKKTGFGEEEQGKIIANIVRELQKNGKLTKPEEKDIFEAAKMTYKFNSTSNRRLSAAIDAFNDKINIEQFEDSPRKDAVWTSTGANPPIPIGYLTEDRGHPDLSLNMVKSSIEELKTGGDFTVDDIIDNLRSKGVFNSEGRGNNRNKHLHDTLVAMKQQGVTQEEIEEAIKSDEAWDDLIGKVKKTEFQRHVIQDSIWRIEKANPQFTIDDIIKDLQSVSNSAELNKNLEAMKKQAVTRKEIETAIKSDEEWNDLIGKVKKTGHLQDSIKETIDQLIKQPKVTNNAELNKNLEAMRLRTKEEIEKAIENDEKWNKLIKEKGIKSDEELNKLITDSLPKYI